MFPWGLPGALALSRAAGSTVALAEAASRPLPDLERRRLGLGEGMREAGCRHGRRS